MLSKHDLEYFRAHIEAYDLLASDIEEIIYPRCLPVGDVGQLQHELGEGTGCYVTAPCPDSDTV